MGCFLGCFGGPKERKRRKAVRRIPSRSRERKVPENSNLLQAISDPAWLPRHIENGPTLKPSPQTPAPPLQVEAPVRDSNLQLGREESEKAALSSQKKKVTFDLNVTTYEETPLPNATEVESSIELPKREEEQEEEEKNEKKTKEEFAANHRYQNCVADDEDDDYDFDEEDDSDEEEEEEAENEEEEESYDSYFSLPMNKEKPQTFDDVSSPAMPAAPPTAAANSGGAARDRSQYVHSVLNPVENLSQWKSVATKASPQALKPPRKENISLLERETELPKKSQKISVDASLSNWLSNNSPGGSNSSITREERPILGALTAEDLSKSPKSSPSPRKSPIQRSAEDIPILGGCCGSSENSFKGIPNTTSKYREDRRVNWHSTPFEVRLERTLNRGNAEAY